MAFDFRGEAVRGLAALRDILDRLIGEELTPQPLLVDVLETDEYFILHAALPGMQPDDVLMQVQGNLITIQAELKAAADEQQWLMRERPSVPYARTIALPATIAAEEAHARLVDGLLTLHLPKAAPIKTITLAARPPVAEETAAHDAIREAEAIITAHLEDNSATAPTEEVMITAAEQLAVEEPFAEEPFTGEPLAEEVAVEESFAAEPIAEAAEMAADEPHAEAADATTSADDASAASDEIDEIDAVMRSEADISAAEARVEDDADADAGEPLVTEEIVVEDVQAEVKAAPVLADAASPDLLADALSADELAETRADMPLADVLEDSATPEPVGELAAAHEDSHS